MVFEDFGELLFRDILKVAEYPGSPFSGNIVTDLVLYFFIPTVLLIVVIQQAMARVTGSKGLRILVGIAVYLYVVFQGLFSLFIKLGNAYFLMLIILAVVYFVLRSFVGGRGASTSKMPVEALEGGYSGGRGAGRKYGMRKPVIDPLERHALEEELKEIEKELREWEKRKKESLEAKLPQPVEQADKVIYQLTTREWEIKKALGYKAH